MSLYAQNAQGSLCDWVFSGTLERFPDLKIAYAESQVGWMPFQLERMDAVWRDGRGGVDDVPVAAERAGPGPGLRLRLRRPARPQGPRRRRPRARSCSRPTTRTPTAPSRTPARSPTSCSRPRAWTPRSATRVLRGNAIEAYGLAALRHHDVVAVDQLARHRRSARARRPPQRRGRPRAQPDRRCRGHQRRRLPGAGGGPALAGPPQRPHRHLRRCSAAPPAACRSPSTASRRPGWCAACPTPTTAGGWSSRPPTRASPWPSRSTPSCTGGRTPSPPTTRSATSWPPPWPGSPSSSPGPSRLPAEERLAG